MQHVIQGKSKSHGGLAYMQRRLYMMLNHRTLETCDHSLRTHAYGHVDLYMFMELRKFIPTNIKHKYAKRKLHGTCGVEVFS